MKLVEKELANMLHLLIIESSSNSFLCCVKYKMKSMTIFDQLWNIQQEASKYYQDR